MSEILKPLFVSYSFTNQKGGFGFGSVVVCEEINVVSGDDMVYITEGILKSNSNYKEVVVLYFRRME